VPEWGRAEAGGEGEREEVKTSLDVKMGHPSAEVFPVMVAGELAELAKDIRENGLLDPIVTYEDYILDGRNRFRACKAAGVEPRFVEWDGSCGSPTLYVVAKNLHRRQLTPSQCSTIGVELLPLLQAEAKNRQREHGGTSPGHPSQSLPVDLPEVFSGDVRDIAGKAVGVSGSTVDRARQVKTANPQGYERLKRGESTVNAEYEKTRATPRPPRKSTATGKRRAVLEKAHKRKMEVGLSTIHGICTGLRTLKVDHIQAVCSPEEIHTWSKMARELARELRNFARDLEDGEDAEEEV
jgi:hypothetical protein